MKWISVEDELPSSKRSVLCCIAGGMAISYSVMSYDEFDNSWNYDNDFEGRFFLLDYERVTHWLPFPKHLEKKNEP
jgi:hypothetical protein